jgi:hypothetical protein
VSRVAGLAAAAIAGFAIVASAQQATALPAGHAPLSATQSVSAPSSSLTLFASPSQASAAHGPVALRVFGFEQTAANGFSAPSHTYFDGGSAPSSADLEHYVDLPGSWIGATAPQSSSFITAAVFGVALTQSASENLDAAPVAFASLTSSAESGAPAGQPLNASNSLATGLKFKLLGGEHVIAFDEIATQSSIGLVDPNSSPFFFGSPASSPASAVIGLDRTFQRLALGTPSSSSLLAIGSGDTFATPAFAPAQPLSAGTQIPLGEEGSIAQGASVQLNFPLTLGNVDARLSLSGRDMRDIRQTLIGPASMGVGAPSALSGRYQEFHGGVTIGVPVFKRKAEVSLNGVIDRLVNIEKPQTTYGAQQQQPLGLNPFVPTTSNLLTQSNPTLTLDPNYVNLRRYVGAYAVAVPISRVLTANMQYVDQRYGADAVNELTPDLNVGTRSATFGVLYKIPNTNASINLNFNQYKFLDDVTPSNNFVKNQQNLFFTVKF